MKKQIEQLIEINMKGRVFALCQSRGVVDPLIIGYYSDILQQAVHTELQDDTTPVEFNQILDRQVDWLAKEIDQNGPAAEQDQDVSAEAVALVQDAEDKQPSKRSSGYVPRAKSMPERLEDERYSIKQLLENDCVTLKLITPSQAKQFKLRLLGKETKEAEKELVAELRGILHQQIRAFMRKHEGGPWATATLQHELRMDIMAIRSMRSLVSMTKDLLYERKEWLDANKPGFASRLFGGKLRFKK